MRPQTRALRVRFHLTWTWRPAGKSLGANKWRCLCSPQSFEVNRRKVQGDASKLLICFAQMYNNKFDLYRNFPDTQNNPLHSNIKTR